MLKFKGNYKGTIVFFTMQHIFGNKIGIPCIDVNGEAVSIHILDYKQFTGLDDIKGNDIYDEDRVEAEGVKGIVVFDSGAWCMRIEARDKGYTNYDIGQTPALFEFEKTLKLIR